MQFAELGVEVHHGVARRSSPPGDGSEVRREDHGRFMLRSRPCGSRRTVLCRDFEEVTPRAAKQVLALPDRGARPPRLPWTLVSVQHLTKPRVALTIRKYDQRKYGVKGKKPRPGVRRGPL